MWIFSTGSEVKTNKAQVRSLGLASASRGCEMVYGHLTGLMIWIHELKILHKYALVCPNKKSLATCYKYDDNDGFHLQVTNTNSNHSQLLLSNIQWLHHTFEHKTIGCPVLLIPDLSFSYFWVTLSRECARKMCIWCLQNLSRLMHEKGAFP